MPGKQLARSVERLAARGFGLLLALAVPSATVTRAVLALERGQWATARGGTRRPHLPFSRALFSPPRSVAHFGERGENFISRRQSGPIWGARGRGKRAIDGDASAAPRCGCRQQAPTISNAERRGAESERDEAAISYATRRQRPEIMIVARSQITGERRRLAARNGPDGLLIRVAAGGRQITLLRAPRQLGAAHAERAIRSPACARPVIWRRVPHCAARKKAPSATQIALAIDPPLLPVSGSLCCCCCVVESSWRGRPRARQSSRFAEQERSRIHGVEAAQVRNDDALQVVLVDLVLCQNIVLAQYIGLNNQRLQGGCIDFHHYRVTSRRGLYTVLHALEVAPSLSEEIFDLMLTTDATGCSRLSEMLKFHGNQCGVLAVGIQHLGGLGKLSHGPSR
ncbi:hypothetical protein MTO96_021250 [Rhipicephalus appendiculatus]